MRISDWSSDVCSSDLKHAILYLVRRAFDVSDAEVARGRFDLVDRRRRDDRDAVPLGPMRLDDRAGFGVDLARDMLLVEFLAEGDEALLVEDRKSTRLNSSH